MGMKFFALSGVCGEEERWGKGVGRFRLFCESFVIRCLLNKCEKKKILNTAYSPNT